LLCHAFRMSPGRSADAFTWESSLREAVGKTTVSAAGLSSVIPGASAAVIEAVQRIYRVPLMEIHHSMRLPIELAYQTPQTLGADRLAAAAAAHVMFGQAHNVVVVDAGTAVTFEVIDRTGVYRGGCIAPGPAMMQHSLHVETAQLPEVPLEIPANPIGRSTHEAIQAGILYGMIDSVRGMIRRLSAELDEPPIVVATGGWGELLSERIAEVHRLESHLVLHGIRILMELNSPGGDDPASPNES
jgi:type III pantothenate kinase